MSNQQNNKNKQDISKKSRRKNCKIRERERKKIKIFNCSNKKRITEKYY